MPARALLGVARARAREQANKDKKAEEAAKAKAAKEAAAAAFVNTTPEGACLCAALRCAMHIQRAFNAVVCAIAHRRVQAARQGNGGCVFAQGCRGGMVRLVGQTGSFVWLARRSFLLCCCGCLLLFVLLAMLLAQL